VATHERRDIASLSAFCHAADGLSNTVVIAVTENGESICGACLDPAWRGGCARDNSKSSLFTLKNHARIGPTKFPKKAAFHTRRSKCGDRPGVAFKFDRLVLDREFGVEHQLVDVLFGMDPLPRGDEVAPPFGHWMTAAFEEQLLEWLPEAETAQLVAAHDGRDIASINAFCDAADGLSKTVVIAVTENGESICGAYLDPAWRESAWVLDGSQQSFLFTLKNHAGVVPTKFLKKGSDSGAAYKWRDYGWHFGYWEGPYIYRRGTPLCGGLGSHYKDVVGQGQAIFNGGPDFFRLGALADRVRACFRDSSQEL
jgi:hypothetical protein